MRASFFSTRRWCLGLLGFSAALLVGCGREDTSRSNTPSPRSFAQSQALTLYTWDEYIDPDVVTAFTKKTGIDVAIETFEDTDGIEQAVRSEPSRYDLIIFDGDKVEKLRKLGLLHELDHKKLPQLSNIAPKYRNLAIDPGNRFSVPYLWGTTLLAYRKDKIQDTVDSWSLLWDPRYRGKVAMITERLESCHVALFKNGYSMNARDEDALAAARGDLLSQISDMNVRYVEGIPSEVERLLGSGETWAMVAYSGDAASLAESDDRIGMVIPKEGAAMWIDNLVITRYSRNLDAAHTFINFLLTPEIAAQNATSLCYATPNAKALPHIDAEIREDPSIFPPAEVLAHCEFAGSLTPDRERPMHAIWQDVMSAYQSQQAESGVQITGHEAAED